jgi:hypothetical protein
VFICVFDLDHQQSLHQLPKKRYLNGIRNRTAHAEPNRRALAQNEVCTIDIGSLLASVDRRRTDSTTRIHLVTVPAVAIICRYGVVK